MLSSPCLNGDHDQCNAKACNCVCHDKICPECKGKGEIVTLLQPPVLRTTRIRDISKELKDKKTCKNCGGRGKLRFVRDVIITMPDPKKDSDCPF